MSETTSTPAPGATVAAEVPQTTSSSVGATQTAEAQKDLRLDEGNTAAKTVRTTRDGKQVVVKRITFRSDADAAAAVAEGSRMMGLRHPAILTPDSVTLLPGRSPDGESVVEVVSEYCALGNLDQVVGQLGTSYVRDRVGRRLMEGLSFLGTNGVAHRNLKPSNILFRAACPAGGDPELVIADGGAALHAANTLTPAGLAHSTWASAAFWPPELHATGAATQRGDLFSGALLLCCIYGNVAPSQFLTQRVLPWQMGETDLQVTVLRHLKLARTRAGVIDVTLEMLAYKPGARPALRDVMTRAWPPTFTDPEVIAAARATPNSTQTSPQARHPRASPQRAHVPSAHIVAQSPSPPKPAGGQPLPTDQFRQRGANSGGLGIKRGANQQIGMMKENFARTDVTSVPEQPSPHPLPHYAATASPNSTQPPPRQQKSARAVRIENALDTIGRGIWHGLTHVGANLADFFGIDSDKYYYEIETYKLDQVEAERKKRRKEKEASELAALESGTGAAQATPDVSQSMAAPLSQPIS
ncbi:hypothetical protein PAPYR_6810 [Paratrimastix pyriformis]|uniref:Protein kinase domain-containing protein n=1 Tax=Paratrimastix pyriformis TaxID=342808 RepID=A0ABQ8UJP4_9EUKA|nr:hypothetical protein PAPYR_6810 [Paratrimastix pyriformis]